MNKKVIGYVRVSTQEQATEGISLNNQEKRIKALCIAKDWELVEIIKDKGFSGKSLKRPGIQEIIKKILNKNNNIEGIIIYKLDRLTRSVKDLGYLIEEIFEKNNVFFTSVSDNFDTSTANGKLILNILGSVAQWERDIIAERTKDALSYKKSIGECCGQIPFGFKKDKNNKLIPDIYHQETIKIVKDQKNNGNSLREIALFLERSGRKNTKNITKWSKTQISNIIKIA